MRNPAQLLHQLGGVVGDADVLAAAAFGRADAHATRGDLALDDTIVVGATPVHAQEREVRGERLARRTFRARDAREAPAGSPHTAATYPREHFRHHQQLIVARVKLRAQRGQHTHAQHKLDPRARRDEVTKVLAGRGAQQCEVLTHTGEQGVVDYQHGAACQTPTWSRIARLMGSGSHARYNLTDVHRDVVRHGSRWMLRTGSMAWQEAQRSSLKRQCHNHGSMRIRRGVRLAVLCSAVLCCCFCTPAVCSTRLLGFAHQPRDITRPL